VRPGSFSNFDLRWVGWEHSARVLNTDRFGGEVARQHVTGLTLALAPFDTEDSAAVNDTRAGCAFGARANTAVVAGRCMR
jgi:hypothetical protein